MTRITVTLFALCLISVVVPAQQGGWWHDLYAAKKLALEELLDKATSHRGAEVILTVQLNGMEKADESYLTPFTEAKYQRFSAWSEIAPLWERSVFDAPFKRFYVAHNSLLKKRLADADRYARFRITGRVVDVIKGQPWIEVTRADPIPRALDEATIRHMVKGYTLRNIKRHTAAAVEFRAAEHDGLPLHVRTLLMREEADAFHRVGKADYALGRLRDALALIPGEESTKNLQDAIRAKSGLGPVRDEETVPAQK